MIQLLTVFGIGTIGPVSHQKGILEFTYAQGGIELLVQTQEL